VLNTIILYSQLTVHQCLKVSAGRHPKVKDKKYIFKAKKEAVE